MRYCHPAAADPSCTLCAWYESNPAYRAFADTVPAFKPPQPAPATAPLSLPCIHLGPPTGETVRCASCTGNVWLKLQDCAVHGSCTPGRAVKDVACCRTCLDHDPVCTRHLAFHLYPLARSETVWRRHVEHLRRRWGLFNGLRLVALALDEHTSPVEMVRSALPPDAEVFELANDPDRREGASWALLLGRILSKDPSHFVFYFQGKGVTHEQNSGTTVHDWTDLIYETCLDHWPFVWQQLRRHPIVVPLKKLGRGFIGTTWHSCGSAFWAGCAPLYARRWWEVDRHFAGVESTPGRLYQAHEAGCLFHEARAADMDLYRKDVLGPILARLPAWREERRAR